MLAGGGGRGDPRDVRRCDFNMPRRAPEERLNPQGPSLRVICAKRLGPRPGRPLLLGLRPTGRRRPRRSTDGEFWLDATNRNDAGRRRNSRGRRARPVRCGCTRSRIRSDCDPTWVGRSFRLSGRSSASFTWSRSMAHLHLTIKAPLGEGAAGDGLVRDGRYEKAPPASRRGLLS